MDKHTSTHTHTHTHEKEKSHRKGMLTFISKVISVASKKIVAAEKMKTPFLLIALVFTPSSVMRPQGNVINMVVKLIECKKVTK